MKRIIVLGAGMVGSAIAIDLSRQFEVSIADINEKKLAKLTEENSLKSIHGDLSSKEFIKDIIKDYDLVIGAVPGFMGFNTVKTVIENGKDIVDISFFDEDPFQLDELAKRNKVTAIVDCGVAPGLSNIIIGYHDKNMKLHSAEILVGGLPVKRKLPFQYKAPFSPVDVIEEYMRPARFLENGKIVTRPALSEAELIDIDPIGTLEAFNTDGLRSLLYTLKIPNMKEKTLRYPGHVEYIKVLRDSGFFGENPVELKGAKVRPIDFTSKLLFDQWKPDDNEPEFTVMRITLKGEEKNKLKKYVYTLFDKFDAKTKISSMARTTGYTCTAAARLVLSGNYSNKGISSPEFIGANDKCFDLLIQDLSEHNINLPKQGFDIQNELD